MTQEPVINILEFSYVPIQNIQYKTLIVNNQPKNNWKNFQKSIWLIRYCVVLFMYAYSTRRGAKPSMET